MKSETSRIVENALIEADVDMSDRAIAKALARRIALCRYGEKSWKKPAKSCLA
jgi:hypothetical protein